MQWKWYCKPHFLTLPYKAISSFSCWWISPKPCQRMSLHHICPTSNLNHANPWSIAGETAESVENDGIRELDLLLHLNHWPNSLGFFANLNHLEPSTMPEPKVQKLCWGPPKMAGEDPKKAKETRFLSIWGTTAHGGGVPLSGTL